MPRQARKPSSTGIYHIMLRGINRQQIFEDVEDRERFIETLFNYKEVCGYSGTRGRFSCPAKIMRVL